MTAAELKRVIAAYGDRVVMDETLAALIQGARPGRPARGGTGQNRARRPRGRSRAGGAEPLQWRYPAAEIRQLGRLGAELDARKPLLEELSQHSAGREPVEQAPSLVRPKDKLP